MTLKNYFEKAKAAARETQTLADGRRNEILNKVAGALLQRQKELLAANRADLARMEESNPLYDRLKLTPERIATIAADMRNVATLPSPLGIETKRHTLDNGLLLRRVSVPFGVVGIIYEARPNVTFDVFSLCLKSGNACVLKGGHDADASNRKGVEIVRSVLEESGVNPDVLTLLPATHEATAQMLDAVGYVDICIPRGGRRLIDFVRQNARVPVIETGAGVVDAYFDAAGDAAMGARIINNAKTRRVSVCNALDCLLVHRSRLADLPQLCEPLAGSHVKIYADGLALEALRGHYPADLLLPATPASYGTEFMDYVMAVKTVDSLEAALAHIARYGSGHSECIITADEATARRFQQAVDAACVYWNAPTSFTDGAQFGLGAEIGISTQKLGPRGPMALEEMTTYKWLIDGNGQIRKP